MKKSKIFMIFGIVVLVIAIVGSTLAYYVWNTSSDEETKIVTDIGAATVYFDGGSSIENANIRPVSDKSKGIVKTVGFKGSVSGIIANLYLDIVSLDSDLKNSTFKFAFYNGSTLVKEGNFSTDYLNSNTEECTENSTSHITLLTNLSLTTSIKSYTLYIWIDGTQDNPKEMMGKQFSFKLHATGTGGIIREGLIPDITTTVSNSFANALVSKYLTNVSADKTSDVLLNSIKYKYDAKNKMMSDVGGNLRYYGATPNNYIYFNCDDYSNQTSSTCEVWRIIGVFEGKVKIMRGSQIGKLAWDQDKNIDSSKKSYDNDWSTSSLQVLLNTSYLNRTANVTYYSGISGTTTTTVQTSTIGIKDSTRNMISETMWYLRGWNTNSVYADQMYEYERTTGKVYNTTRPTSWTGKIALAYPSDYGYAADLSVCQKQLGSYNDATCTANNWMKNIITNNGGNVGWLLTPNSGYSGSAWYVVSSDSVGSHYYTYYAYGVGPVLYLNSELGIKSGDGSSSAPYQLSA